MRIERLFFSVATAAIALASMSASTVALAQTEPEENQEAPLTSEVVEEGPPQEDIVVTGSRIRRQSNSAIPLVTVGAEDFKTNAIKDARDLVGILPISSGAENNSDNLTQNFTAGTSNINLRGLGVASTLVLLNGRRQVLSSVNTDDGSSFVDLGALLPTLAIGSVDVLKDGASAIYGSDAVAGVVNFNTRRNFQGLEIQGEYRARTNDGTQRDVTLDGVFGGGNADDVTFLLAASYLDRSSLLLGETDFLRPSLSGSGNPGSFRVPSLGRTVADPNCASSGGFLQTLANGSTLCRFDFGPQITAVPVEKRLQAYGRIDWTLNENVKLWSEIGYARNRITREVSPSFAVLNTPRVPVNNPGNIFGENVFFQGRAYGVGQPTETNFYKHNTFRIALGADGKLAEDWFYDVSYISASNNSIQNPRDTIAANFQAALEGFGGIGCDRRPNAPTPAVAGQGQCLFFNPFSSALTARPGDPTYNDPSLRNFIIGDYVAIAESTLDVVEGNVTGKLFDLGGRDVSIALGAQYRKQTIDYRYDSIAQQDGFGFLIGNRNFNGNTNVYALYGEILVPAAEWAELTAAVRYEKYSGGVGTTVNPKFSALLRPIDGLSLRGSYGTSFRAPSVFQTQGIQTNFVNITDFDRTTTFAGRRVLGSQNLKPEQSRAVNLGVTWNPVSKVELSADYFNFSFRDVLTIENAQAIVTANPNDPRIQRSSAGTINIINVGFINADSIKTSGIDFSGRASFETSIGTLSPYFDATLLLSYDVTNRGVQVDGLGRLNRSNVGVPNQKFKGNIGMTWALDPVTVNLVARHTGSYSDDGTARIRSNTTFDVQLNLNIGNLLRQDSETSLSIGVVNLTDRDPPFVNVAGSYDPQTADPRGRRAFIRLGTRL